MRAVLYEDFRRTPTLEKVPMPETTEHGIILRVEATGLCRSDWHGWMGHDPDISLPHVPGHEFAGLIEEVGSEVSRWQPGDRVTAPFVCACGSCPQCLSQNQQVCDRQSQPGFTHWGSFAEFVSVQQADLNLVRLPDDMESATAASLGCRFATAFRAVVDQGQLQAGQWLAVHGCGGVGLSAILIAKALGAKVVGVDIHEAALARARELGADVTLHAERRDVVGAVRDATDGGAHVSIDALGSAETSFASIDNLRKRGRHVQVGLMFGEDRNAAVPMGRIVADELEIVGSHGIQAFRYDGLLRFITEKNLRPERLIGQRIGLEDAGEALHHMGNQGSVGMTIIEI